MGSEQKPKERVPLKEIQAKRRRARIVGKFCGYTSLVCKRVRDASIYTSKKYRSSFYS